MEPLVPAIPIHARRLSISSMSSPEHLKSGRPLACNRRGRVRLAFTLLELLIAMAVIGILAGLLLTVAGGANKAAHDAQVAVDIQNLAKSIAAFKQTFNVEPPSRITLYEQATGWTTDTTDGPRSMGLIRQIWPQFDFNYTAEGGQIDINGDGFNTGDGSNTTNGTITLTGAECLVFFLGGIPSAASPANKWYASPLATVAGAPTGFSLNPADPFSRTGSNRQHFHEFDASRLFLYLAPGSSSPHTMNTYKDTYSGQTQPYLYYSTYGGQGYDITEIVGSTANISNAPEQTFVDFYRQGSPGYWASPPPPFTQNSSSPAPLGIRTPIRSFLRGPTPTTAAAANTRREIPKGF